MRKNCLVVLLWIPFLACAQNLKIGECFIHKDKDTEYCFAADSTTFDSVLGDSYRIFLVSNKAEDTELARYVLRVNLAADFPYEFNSEFLHEYNLLIIQGVQAFYLYNTNTNILSNYIRPIYDDCAFSDTQGTKIGSLQILKEGSVLQLEVNECGIHSFDIRDITLIKEI